MKSISTDIDYIPEEETTYLEFILEKGKEIIGRYNVVVNNVEISLTYFEIYKKRNGYGKEALSIIDENLLEIAKENNVNELEICAKPMDNSINLKDLVLFYKKYLNVEIDYDNGTSVILRKDIKWK